MKNEGKAWPPVLVAADSVEQQAEITKGLTAAGFNEIATATLSETEDRIAKGGFSLSIVSWVDSPDSARTVVESLRDTPTAVLSLVSRVDQQVIHALKSGSDSVAVFPDDLKRIGLPAILAFDHARVRMGVNNAHIEMDSQRRDNNARVRNIIHDLKNPLTVTMGNLQVLQTIPEIRDAENINKMLESAWKGCRSLLNMMGNLTDLIKLEENRYHLNLEEFDPTKLLQQQLSNYSELDSKKTWFLVPFDPVKVRADRALFDRAVSNLLNHSMHHTRSGDRIEVAVAPDARNGQVHFHFTDNGIPVDKGMGDDIFDCALHSLDDQNNQRWDTGMMLAFVKLALFRMSGEVQVDKDSETGAHFIIRLPSAT